MLNTATPILQFKLSGIDLTTIQTLTVTIRSQGATIIKGNSDIEVDNDVISVFLTQSESNSLKNGNFNVSISAFNLDGTDVSQSVSVEWTKRSSMSKPSGGGGGTGDLSDYYTKQEVDVLVQEIPKGQDGFSPTAKVEKTGSTATITIVDKNKKTEASVADGKDGKDGADGTDGFSPTIVPNKGNTSTSYKLDITTKEGTFTTPNLKGKDGDGSGGSSGGLFAFELRDDGHLYVISDDETQAQNFYINDEGHLVYRLEG